MDAVLAELTGRTGIPRSPAIGRARAALAASTTDLVGVPDETLEAVWPWRGEEADIRYGLYRCLELVEAVEAEVGRSLESAARQLTLGGAPPAVPVIARATAARWDLHGLLAGLDDVILDRDPGGDQWTVRQTLGHIVAGQRGYSWFSAWWLNQVGVSPPPSQVPDDVAERLPDEFGPEMAGSLAEIRARLDEVVDDAAAQFGGLDDAALAVRAKWAGIEVDIGFRLGRWSSHIEEHTIQVEKTLAMLARTPSEVERIVRLVLGAYGRVEALVFGRDPDDLTAPDDRGVTAEDALARLDEVASTAASVRAAVAPA